MTVRVLKTRFGNNPAFRSAEVTPALGSGVDPRLRSIEVSILLLPRADAGRLDNQDKRSTSPKFLFH